MLPEKVKIYIGTPCYTGAVKVGYHVSILKTIELCRQLDIDLSFDIPMGDGDVGHSRNAIVSRFLKTDFTHLMFIDDDVVWPEQAIIRLLEVDRDIVGGAYPKKIDGPVTYPVIDPFGPMDEHGCQEVRGLGAGFLMIRREVFEKMAEVHQDLHYQEDGEDLVDYFVSRIIQNRRASEDVGFCLMAEAAGFKIWLRQDFPLGHVGIKAWSGCYAVTERQKMQVAAE